MRGNGVNGSVWILLLVCLVLSVPATGAWAQSGSGSSSPSGDMGSTAQAPCYGASPCTPPASEAAQGFVLVAREQWQRGWLTPAQFCAQLAQVAQTLGREHPRAEALRYVENEQHIRCPGR